MNVVDRGAKLDVGDFSDDNGLEAFFNWIHSLESFFRWYKLSDERKLFFAEVELKGTARIWWDQHQRNLYIAARRWEDMKTVLTRRFVPSDYKQRVYLYLTELVQGSKFVAEYTSMFYSLVTRSEFPWVEEVLISMYRRGLNLEIAGSVTSGKLLLLALAQAILKTPAILLLDEATSALDTKSQNIVQNALEKIMIERTCVVVAHQLSTIQKSNRISVIDRGRIVEEGSHDDLLGKGEKSVYFSLVRLQQQAPTK